MKQYIVYYRVSTKGQGLGIDAQRDIVARYLAPADGAVISEYTEVESGRCSTRPQLLKALEECKRTGGTLVVAKLDRLARNVLLIAKLMESKVDFICCDMPHANKFTLHVMAAMAEYEASLISERTKAALQVVKARGKKLGGRREKPPTFVSKEAKAARLEASYGRAIPVIRLMKEQGASLREIADRLNKDGIRTPSGKNFQKGTVDSILKRVLV